MISTFVILSVLTTEFWPTGVHWTLQALCFCVVLEDPDLMISGDVNGKYLLLLQYITQQDA
jgi:hypothetical protein